MPGVVRIRVDDRVEFELKLALDRFHVAHPHRTSMLVGVYPWRSTNANRIANVVGVHSVHDQVIGTFTVRFSRPTTRGA